MAIAHFALARPAQVFMRPSGASTLNGSGMTAHVSLWHAAMQAWGPRTSVESARLLGRALLAPRIRAGVAPTCSHVSTRAFRRSDFRSQAPLGRACSLPSTSIPNSSLTAWSEAFRRFAISPDALSHWSSAHAPPATNYASHVLQRPVFWDAHGP